MRGIYLALLLECSSAFTAFTPRYMARPQNLLPHWARPWAACGAAQSRECHGILHPSSQHLNASANAAVGAAVVPVYRALAAVLLWQATRVQWVDTAVLLATAIAACIDLGPAAHRQLASATKAQQRARPPQPKEAGTPGSRSRPGRLASRKAADKWNSVVALKIAGQVVGLVISACGAALAGAACIIAADALFWGLGGGAARFDLNGPAPIADKLGRVLLGANMVMMFSLIIASTAPQGFRRTVGASVYTVGVLTQVVGNEKTRRNKLNGVQDIPT